MTTGRLPIHRATVGPRRPHEAEVNRAFAQADALSPRLREDRADLCAWPDGTSFKQLANVAAAAGLATALSEQPVATYR